MGSEQSQPQNVNSVVSGIPRQPNTGSGPKLQRGYTIATPGHNGDHFQNAASPPHSSSRPVSPPISVCSDSDLPYISYTDRPIGGKLNYYYLLNINYHFFILLTDSPKLRNKGQASTSQRARSNSVPKKPSSFKKPKSSTAHNVVVVHSAAKDPGVEFNAEIQRLKSIPMFLPVMRGTLSLPANRDPEVLERLQPAHLKNICSTMQTHYNTHAKRIANDQLQLAAKVKEVDGEIVRVMGLMVEKQKLYATYAESFSKVRTISQQLTRCNTLLNQNIESMEQLNLMLDVDDRLEPFVWKTS